MHCVLKTQSLLSMSVVSRLQAICTSVLLLSLLANMAFAESSHSEELDINGFKVIYKPSVKEVMSVRFFIRGGTSNYPKAQEGIEALALNIATEGGTKNFSKERYHELLEQNGASITGSSSYDQGNVALTCLAQYWDQSWELFADAILHPAFEETEFELIREKMINAAKQADSDPDTKIRRMALEYAFAGKDYEKKANGSAESLQQLRLEAVESYYRKLLTKSQCFLVVVGDVERTELEAKVRAAFGDLPEGGYTPRPNTTLDITNSSLRTEARPIATNYLRGMLSAPQIGSDDEVPMRVAMAILYDRFFLEIRTKRNLSYAPAAWYPELKNSYAFVYVSTDDPNQSADVMIAELKKINSEGFSKKELENKKGTFLTRHYLKLETNGSQSETLGTAEVQGDWRSTLHFVDEVFAVQVEDINRVIRQYFKGIAWVYLGDTGILNEDIFQQTLQ